ncbi:hypothetical protein BGZ63DRAFT_409479 [Mariannaea sp. PMI_226]|nr:hypothetical protein BGZ63DRAFT_409479 [Mariannaea sp. PMI_226]
MGSLRIFTALFAIISTIIAEDDCFTKLRLHFATISPCGDKEAIAYYLFELQDHDNQAAIASCYINSGCSQEDATYQSKLVLQHYWEHCAYKELRRAKREDGASTTEDSEATTADVVSLTHDS